MQGIKKRKWLFDDFCKFYVKRNWQTLLFAILYITGLSTGVIFLYIASNDIIEQLYRISEKHHFSRNSWESIAVFEASFLSVFWFLAVFFLLGYVTVGKWSCLPLIWFRGLGAGISLAVCYCQNGPGIISYVMRTTLPIVFFQTLVLLLAAETVWWYRENTEERSAGYRLRFLMLMFLSALTALLDVFLSSY